MNKASFLIPNNNNDKIYNNTLLDKEEEFTQICENVYKFGITSINEKYNIYVLYNNALRYKNEHKYNESIELFQNCKNIIDDNKDIIEFDLKDLYYEILINLALLTSKIGGNTYKVYFFYQEAIKSYPDRAEPYYYFSIYCNKIKDFNKSYELLKKSLLLSYDESKNKYPNTQKTSYGKFLYDELSVSCFWLKKYDESRILLETIIDDDDFVTNKERLFYGFTQ